MSTKMYGSSAMLSSASRARSDFRDASVGTDDMYVRNNAFTITEGQVLVQLEPAFLNKAELTDAGTEDVSQSWIAREHDPSLGGQALHVPGSLRIGEHCLRK